MLGTFLCGKLSLVKVVPLVLVLPSEQITLLQLSSQKRIATAQPTFPSQLPSSAADTQQCIEMVKSKFQKKITATQLELLQEISFFTEQLRIVSILYRKSEKWYALNSMHPTSSVGSGIAHSFQSKQVRCVFAEENAFLLNQTADF